MRHFYLPNPDSAKNDTERFCCTLFLKILNGRERNTLSAILTTADEAGLSPELIARTLVEAGLRAPMEYFPPVFSQLLQDRRHIPLWSVAALSKAQHALLALWPAEASEEKTSFMPQRRGHLTLVYAA